MISIVGWAHSKFGKLEGQNVESLMSEMTKVALAHAEIGPDEVDGCFVGVYNNGFTNRISAQVCFPLPIQP